MKRLVVIGVLIGVLLAACGSEEDETMKVVRIAGEEIAIPPDTPRNVFAVTRAVLEKTAYLPWYRNCIVGQAERLMTPAGEQRYRQLSQARRDEVGLELMIKASPHCERPGRALVNPEAAPSELAPIRSQTALTMGLLAQEEGFSTRAQRCTEDRLRQFSDQEIVEFSNAELSRQEDSLLAVFKECTT